jgi:hypothetical protein
MNAVPKREYQFVSGQHVPGRPATQYVYLREQSGVEHLILQFQDDAIVETHELHGTHSDSTDGRFFVQQYTRIRPVVARNYPSFLSAIDAIYLRYADGYRS